MIPPTQGLGALALAAVAVLGAGAFAYRAWKLYRYLRLGWNEDRRAHVGRRLRDELVIYLLQRKLLKRPYYLRGLAHAFIFWGFIVITLGTTDLLASGIFGLPWDIRFSTILSFGTGGATPFLDFSQGFSLENRLATHPFKESLRPPKTWGFADRDVDFRLEKDFRTLGPTSIGVIGEVFNAFNWTNFGCLNNFLGGPNPSPADVANVGKPNCAINLGRREQLGLRVRF